MVKRKVGNIDAIILSHARTDKKVAPEQTASSSPRVLYVYVCKYVYVGRYVRVLYLWVPFFKKV